MERCALAPRELMLARIAALIAVDAPPVSYMANAGAAADSGITDDDLQALMIGISPVVGTPKVVAAAGNIFRALGFAIVEAELAEMDEAADAAQSGPRAPWSLAILVLRHGQVATIGGMPATAVTELGAAGGRGLVIDHLINIEGSFTSNGAPRLRYFEAEPGGRGDVRIGRRGPGNVADDASSRGMKIEHADPAPVTAEPQETPNTPGCVNCWSTYDCDYDDLGGDWFTRRNTDRQRDHLHPTARRTRLLRHPEQDRVGRSPAVIHFTECLRSVGGSICRPAIILVPGWQPAPALRRPVPATSSGRSSSHCCRRRGEAGDRRNTRVDSATFRRNSPAAATRPARRPCPRIRGGRMR